MTDAAAQVEAAKKAVAKAGSGPFDATAVNAIKSGYAPEDGTETSHIHSSAG